MSLLELGGQRQNIVVAALLADADPGSDHRPYFLGIHLSSGRGNNGAPPGVRTKRRLPMIRKLASGEYRLYSRKTNPKTGKRRNLGTFKSRAAAEKHEREVQYFKRH